MSSAAAAPPAQRIPLVDLPDALIAYILEFVPTLDVLSGLAASCTSLRAASWRLLSAVLVDVSHLTPRRTHTPYASTSGIFAQVLRLERVQALHLTAFREMLTDEVAQSLVNRHRGELTEVVLDNSALRSLRFESGELRKLSLENCRGLLDISVRCPRLVEINLSRTNLSDHELGRAMPALPNLRVLRLRSCKNVQSLTVAAPALEILDVSYTGVLDATLGAMCSRERSPRLRVLFAADCKNLRQPALFSPALRVLSLRGCPALRFVSLDCPELRELDVGNTDLEDVAVTRLVNSLPRLSVLSVRECYSLRDPFVDADGRSALAQARLSLASFDASSTAVCGASVNALVSRSPGLRILRLLKSTSAHSDLAARGWDAPALSQLLLRRTNVEDAQVLSLLAGSPRLAVLNLRDCPNVLAQAWTRPGVDSFPAVTEVDLSVCPVTDDALALVLRALPSLVTAHFDACHELRSPAVASATLHHLRMSGCRRLSAARFGACPALERVDLGSSLALSSVEVRPGACPRLRWLSLMHCNPNAAAPMSADYGHVRLALREGREVLAARLPATLAAAAASARAEADAVAAASGAAPSFDYASLTVNAELRPVTPPVASVTPTSTSNRLASSPLRRGAAAAAAALPPPLVLGESLSAEVPAAGGGGGGGGDGGKGDEQEEGAAGAEHRRRDSDPLDFVLRDYEYHTMENVELYVANEHIDTLQRRLDEEDMSDITRYGVKKQLARAKAARRRELRLLRAALEERRYFGPLAGFASPAWRLSKK